MADDSNRLTRELDTLKKKYFALLAENEKHDKEHQETEAFLRRSLARMTHLGEGLDSRLDPHLERLRSAIRANQSSYSLAGLVERVMETAAIEQRQTLQQQLGPALLLKLLDTLPISSGEQAKVAALRRKLEDKQAIRELDHLTTELTQLLGKAPAQAETTATPRSTEPGLLGKLFGKPSTEERSGTEYQVLLKLLDLIDLPPASADKLTTLRERLATEKTTASVLSELAKLLSTAVTPAAIASDASGHPGREGAEALLRLLAHLQLPSELEPDLASIRQRLQQALDNDDLLQVIESIARLIARSHDLNQQEKQELETFLQQITQCLNELSSNLEGADTLRIETHAGNRQFTDTMQAQMQGIEESVQGATELPQLKTLIHTRLGSLRHHLTSYRRSDSLRNQAMKQQINQLKGQVVTLEHESEQLREHLILQQQKAASDPLTGIPNRLAYNERLAAEFTRWQRYGQPLSLAVWDIDRFKSINDSYGHQAGDKVLKGVAAVLQANMRKTDFIARFGGEEFVILMPETPLEHALIACNKLRLLIEQTAFHYNEQAVPVTISCGIAQFHGDASAEHVFERADSALYQAKQAGRNRCVTDTELSSIAAP